MKSLLKYLFVILLAVGCGIAAAYAFHSFRVQSTPENFYHDQWDSSQWEEQVGPERETSPEE